MDAPEAGSGDEKADKQRRRRRAATQTAMGQKLIELRTSEAFSHSQSHLVVLKQVNSLLSLVLLACVCGRKTNSMASTSTETETAPTPATTTASATTAMVVEEATAAIKERCKDKNSYPMWTVNDKISKLVPNPRALPTSWQWEEMRKIMLETAEFVPEEQAERRALMMANPGFGGF